MEKFDQTLNQGEVKGEVKEKYQMVFESVTNDSEAKEIQKKYFSSDSQCDFVSQGGNNVYEGKPLVSDDFNLCGALIAISERSLSLSHIEPGDVRDRVFKNFNKFYPKTEPITFLYVARKGSLSNDIDYELEQSGWSIKEVQSLLIDEGKKYDEWSIAVDPKINYVFVKYKFGTKTVIKKIRLPNLYDHDIHNQSNDLFDSQDYMPKGFREIQRFFESQNYSLKEIGLIAGSQDFSVNPKEWTKGKDKVELSLYKDGSFLDIDIQSGEPLEDILKTMTKDGKTLYLVKKCDYISDKKYKGYEGFVFLYPLERWTFDY